MSVYLNTGHFTENQAKADTLFKLLVIDYRLYVRQNGELRAGIVLGVARSKATFSFDLIGSEGKGTVFVLEKDEGYYEIYPFVAEDRTFVRFSTKLGNSCDYPDVAQRLAYQTCINTIIQLSICTMGGSGKTNPGLEAFLSHVRSIKTELLTNFGKFV